ERFAVHKLIVASRRGRDAGGSAKREKDLHQVRLLAEALSMTRHHVDLAGVYIEAWDRGAHWQQALLAGLTKLRPADADAFRSIVAAGAAELGEDSGRLFKAAGP